MSIAEFSSALKDQAYKSWFKSSSINTLNLSLEEFRPTQGVAARNAFSIDKKTIEGILDKLGRPSTQTDVDALFNKLLTDRKVTTIRRARFDNNTIVFPKIGFDSITTVMNNLFETKAGQISSFYEKGHVLGLATVLTDITADRIRQNTKIEEKNKEVILRYLDQIVAHLKDLDFETSNLQDPKAALYAKYTKSRKKYLIEMQLKDANQASGKQVRALMGTLRALFNPFDNLPAQVAANSPKRAQSKEKLIDNFLEKAGATNTSFISDLVNMKGSPSQLDLIEKEILSILKDGKSSPDTVYTLNEVKISEHKLSKINKTAARNKIAEDIRKIEALKRDIKTKLRSTSGQFISPVSIKNLLNSKLAQQIQKNMGKGTARNVLNYRTGRLANSAEVNEVNTRNGAITAFYSYMKNPYATFAPGGRQSSPESRDPNRLIQLSIRQLATGIMANRLKVVPV
jgi:hypothetical protein